jgi:hypothetical protein
LAEFFLGLLQPSLLNFTHRAAHGGTDDIEA